MQTQQVDPLAACTLVPERQPISSCIPRRRSTVAGLVREVSSVEVDGSTSVVVVIEDEQGDNLTAVWHGRRDLPGIGAGTALALTGTVTEVKGIKKMLDPSYTIISPNLKS